MSVSLPMPCNDLEARLRAGSCGDSATEVEIDLGRARRSLIRRRRGCRRRRRGSSLLLLFCHSQFANFLLLTESGIFPSVFAPLSPKPLISDLSVRVDFSFRFFPSLVLAFRHFPGDAEEIEGTQKADARGRRRQILQIMKPDTCTGVAVVIVATSRFFMASPWLAFVAQECLALLPSRNYMRIQAAPTGFNPGNTPHCCTYYGDRSVATFPTFVWQNS